MKMRGHIVKQTLKLKILDLDSIKTWYEAELVEAFPEEERKPLNTMLDLVKKDEYVVNGIFREIISEKETSSTLVGYATMAKRKNINLYLIDYLGVTKALRNQGIGSKIISLLKEYYSEVPFVLESELPTEDIHDKENLIRERRINFYLRNGLFKAYEMATCGMRWQALVSDMKLIDSQKNLDELAKNHKGLYDDERIDVVVPLKDGEIPPKSFWA